MALPTDPTRISHVTTAAAMVDTERTDEPPHKRARSDVESSSIGDAPLSSNNDQPAGTGTADTTRLYSCGKCSKSYARLDHLSRHVRMHTQEKPYQCQGENDPLASLRILLDATTSCNETNCSAFDVSSCFEFACTQSILLLIQNPSNSLH